MRFVAITAAALVVAGAIAQAGQHGERVASYKELKASAEENNPVAQNNLGVMYATGNGTAQDYSQAAKWYERAGEQGYPVAQYNLGALYEHGLGRPVDPAAAAVWYELAAEQGDAWAQLALGRLLARDDGQRVRAYKWLYLSASAEEGETRVAAAAELKGIAGALTPAELSAATEMVRAFRPRRR